LNTVPPENGHHQKYFCLGLPWLAARASELGAYRHDKLRPVVPDVADRFVDRPPYYYGSRSLT
jgi:hypothetical protein